MFYFKFYILLFELVLVISVRINIFIEFFLILNIFLLFQNIIISIFILEFVKVL